MFQGSKSTDKLAMVIDAIENLPQDRLKTIAIDWKVLDSEETGQTIWCPCLMVELYDRKRPEGIDIEVHDSTGALEEEDGFPEDPETC